MKEKFLFSLVFFVSFAFAQGNAESKLLQAEERLDSLGEYANSTVIGKDDSPVAVSGDFTVRVKHFDYYKPSNMQLGYSDVGYTSEGMRTLISAGLNANIVVSPASFLTVFSSLYLPFDFGGFYTNQLAFSPNRENFGNTGERVQGFHPATDFYGVSLNENMLVGMDMRGGSFGAALIMGGVIWASQSPLTMWERETNPRFVSQYELYEEEKVVSLYYKEKSFKPVKEGGRAFWTNRSFGGMLLDVHTLPWNLKGQLMLAQPNTIDIGSRDGLRLNSVDGTETELRGTYDYRGKVIGGRFAKEKIDLGQASLTVGANYMGVDFDAGQVYEPIPFGGVFLDRANEVAKFENLRVASIDLKGNLTPQLFLSFDFALSWDDTTVFNKTPECVNSAVANCYKEGESVASSPTFGAYVTAQSKHLVPITVEAIYLPKNFYSPYAMSNPDRFPAWRKDQFYAGSGTYRYGPNMLGANLKVEPEFNRGRFDLQYGIHKQVEKGEDVIGFKYNLIGRQLWETSFSWTRHKPFFTLDSGTTEGTGLHYINRIAGKEEGSKYKLTDRTGGLRSGYGETWDFFTPYENVEDAFYCSQIGHYTETEAVCNVPQSVKWNSTVAVDMGYDIGHWFGTDRNIMLQMFTSLSGVSTSFVPVAYTDKSSSDMLMWSLFTQAEPAIAITPNLHGVLVLGFENFRAEKAYIGVDGINSLAGTAYIGLFPKNDKNQFGNSAYYKLAPINIMHTALGFGFDWDFAARAGLHFRYKHLTSNDENVPQNNWKAHHVQAETKVWF